MLCMHTTIVCMKFLGEPSPFKFAALGSGLTAPSWPTRPSCPTHRRHEDASFSVAQGIASGAGAMFGNGGDTGQGVELSRTLSNPLVR